jgi:hypothetical protein
MALSRKSSEGTICIIVTTIFSKPMALSGKSSVGTIYIVATDFNPLKI